jgi:hypothetical protein
VEGMSKSGFIHTLPNGRLTKNSEVPSLRFRGKARSAPDRLDRASPIKFAINVIENSNARSASLSSGLPAPS